MSDDPKPAPEKPKETPPQPAPAAPEAAPKEQVFRGPELKEPTDIPHSREPGKMHVDLYLRAKGVPLWERGGKRAFAEGKGKTFAAEQDFDDIFKKY